MADWSVYFFGDPKNKGHYWIQTSVPDIHRSIYEAFAESPKFMYITAPRGFAKSTIAALIDPLYSIYYNLDTVIILIGKIETHAKRVLRNIKREITKNKKLLSVYGDLSPADRSTPWSTSEIKTRNNVYVRSIGMGGDIRGSLDAMFRPTKIIIDDPQTSKTMREPSTMESHEDYLDRDVMYAIDDRYGKIRFIGNLIGNGCLLQSIMDDRRWEGISFSALVDENGKPDVNGKSIWEAWHSTAGLQKEYKLMAAQGKLDIFMYERMNQMLAGFVKNLKGYKFHQGTLHHQNGQNILVFDDYPDPIPVFTYLGVDPAFAQTKSADERALITFAKGRVMVYGQWVNRTWVLEYDYNFIDPSKLIDRVLELHKKFYYRRVCLEINGGQLIYKYMMEDRMRTDLFWQSHPFDVAFIRNSIDKGDRVWATLGPKVKTGQVYIRGNMSDLIYEMDRFDTNQLHLCDAFEMADRDAEVCIHDIDTRDKSSKYWKRQQEEDERFAWKTLGIPETNFMEW